MEPDRLENIVVVYGHFDSRKEIVLPNTVIRLHVNLGPATLSCALPIV